MSGLQDYPASKSCAGADFSVTLGNRTAKFFS